MTGLELTFQDVDDPLVLLVSPLFTGSAFRLFRQQFAYSENPAGCGEYSGHIRPEGTVARLSHYSGDPRSGKLGDCPVIRDPGSGVIGRLSRYSGSGIRCNWGDCPTIGRSGIR
jgi:hypothetical protein